LILSPPAQDQLDSPHESWQERPLLVRLRQEVQEGFVESVLRLPDDEIPGQLVKEVMTYFLSQGM
jgi:hypothetical protein